MSFTVVRHCVYTASVCRIGLHSVGAHESILGQDCNVVPSFSLFFVFAFQGTHTHAITFATVDDSRLGATTCAAFKAYLVCFLVAKCLLVRFVVVSSTRLAKPQAKHHVKSKRATMYAPSLSTTKMTSNKGGGCRWLPGGSRRAVVCWSRA